MSRRKVFYINFSIKPYSVEVGHLKIIDNVLEYIELKNDKIIKLEHKGEIINVEARNIYLKQKDAEDRFREYTITKHFKETHRHVCHYCREKILDYKEVTVDHIIAKCNGGDPFDPNNMYIACKHCNQAKDKMSHSEFITYLNVKKKSQFRRENIGRHKTRKIGRCLDLKMDNLIEIAKNDGRLWDVNVFNKIGSHFGNRVDKILNNASKNYISIN